jgi:hypothetical protein
LTETQFATWTLPVMLVTAPPATMHAQTALHLLRSMQLLLAGLRRLFHEL